MGNINISHWAYKRQNYNGVVAQIRRHMEETNISSWKKVAERTGGSMLDHQIMVFDGHVVFQGKRYKVLYLEIWYYDDDNSKDERYAVDCIYSDVEVAQ